MKRMLLILAVMFVCAPAAACATSQTTPTSQVGGSLTASKTGTDGGDQHQIVIQASSFVPLVVDVKPGDTVTWVNRDTQPHTITSIRYFQDEDDISHIYIGESFDSGYVMQGQSYTRTFSDAGSFWYISLPLHNALPIPEYQQLVAELSVGTVVVSG